MSILFTAMALAAAPTPGEPVPAARPMQAQSAQHAQPPAAGAKPQADGCCCKTMAGGAKMACCAEHGKGHGGEHSGHGANR